MKFRRSKMEKITLDELLKICSSFKKIRYDVFDRDSRKVFLRRNINNIEKIIPSKIDEIQMFEPMGLIIDINIYSGLKSSRDYETGILIRLLLHIKNLKEKY